MLGKQKNINFKPWKNDNAPRNPHSCFGDFPLEHMQVKKIEPVRREQNQEFTMAATTINKV